MNDFALAAEDYIDGARLAPLWWRLGIEQITTRFRRTLLGPAWVAASMLATSVALTYVYGSLFGTDYRTTFPSVIAGILAWFLISGTLVEASSAFTGASGMMQMQRLPLSFHIFLHMQKALVSFGIQFAAFVLALAATGLLRVPNWEVLFALPLVFAFLFAASYLIAIVSTRYRDVGHMIGFVVQLLFFVTPIFWKFELLPPQKQAVIGLNPLWHIVELVRQPLLGHPAAGFHWAWTIGLTIALAAVDFMLVVAFRRRVVFWL